MADPSRQETLPDEVEQLRRQAAELQAEVVRLRQALAVVQVSPHLQAASTATRRAREQAADAAGMTEARMLDDGLGPSEYHSASSRAALLRSEDRLHAIVESAVDYVIITADFQNRITGWNSGATRLLG